MYPFQLNSFQLNSMMDYIWELEFDNNLVQGSHFYVVKLLAVSDTGRGKGRIADLAHFKLDPKHMNSISDGSFYLFLFTKLHLM